MEMKIPPEEAESPEKAIIVIMFAYILLVMCMFTAIIAWVYRSDVIVNMLELLKWILQ